MEGLWFPWMGILWTLAMLGSSNLERQDLGLRHFKMLHFRATFMANPLKARNELCRDEKSNPTKATLLPICFIQVTVRESGVAQDICQADLGRAEETLPGPRWYVIQWVCTEKKGAGLSASPRLSFRIKR